jgi:hypothetical protein
MSSVSRSNVGGGRARPDKSCASPSCQTMSALPPGSRSISANEPSSPVAGCGGTPSRTSGAPDRPNNPQPSPRRGGRNRSQSPRTRARHKSQTRPLRATPIARRGRQCRLDVGRQCLPELGPIRHATVLRWNVLSFFHRDRGPKLAGICRCTNTLP